MKDYLNILNKLYGLCFGTCTKLPDGMVVDGLYWHKFGLQSLHLNVEYKDLA